MLIEEEDQQLLQVLVFNCSPHMDKGSTALILNPFVEGLREAGADVELFYLKMLRIRSCEGDQSCWFKTPGECFQKDDMNLLYPKLQAADVIVFGTLVYLDGMVGSMKNLVDRLLPLMEPYIEIRDGHCRHTVCAGHKRAKVVLVSSCGFWEMDNFDPLIAHLKAICKNLCWEFAGALLRPHSEALLCRLKKGLPVDDVLKAARKAGNELVKDGKMCEETLGTVSRELSPCDVVLDKLNESFKRTLSSRDKAA